MTFSRSDLHPKKEHSRNYVTDEGGKMDRKDFQRYLAVGFSQFCEAEVLCHPCTSEIRSARAFSLSRSCFSAHRCLMAAISCEVRAACRAAVFCKNEIRALKSSCFKADSPVRHSLGRRPSLTAALILAMRRSFHFC